MNITRILFLVVMLIFTTGTAMAGAILVDPNTGKYLGNLNSNPYDPNSVANPYGQYGSQYSPDSINNPYGQYGSPYSPDSATNPYSSGGPVIIDPDGGTHIGGY